MHPMRLAAVAIAAAVAACDPTATVIRGISNGGGGATADALAFTVQPASAAAGDIITPAIQVAARDTLGNVDLDFTGNVTVALGANATGATLGGTRTVAAVSGVASFGDLIVDKTGTYTLNANAAGATTAASAAFAITEPVAASVRVRGGSARRT